RSSLVPLRQGVRQGGQDAVRVPVRHRGLGRLRMGADRPAAALQPQQVHEGDLPLLFVGADGLAELRRVAAHVQHVVPDLEGQPQLLGVRFGGGHQPAASARRGHAQAAGPGDHGPGLEPVD
ncbi:HTH-type transcriptional repressor yvoA, partial [Dysosmobacter welbionis]